MSVGIPYDVDFGNINALSTVLLVVLVVLGQLGILLHVGNLSNIPI